MHTHKFATPLEVAARMMLLHKKLNEDELHEVMYVRSLWLQPDSVLVCVDRENDPHKSRTLYHAGQECRFRQLWKRAFARADVLSVTHTYVYKWNENEWTQNKRRACYVVRDIDDPNRTVYYELASQYLMGERDPNQIFVVLVTADDRQWISSYGASNNRERVEQFAQKDAAFFTNVKSEVVTLSEAQRLLPN